MFFRIFRSERKREEKKQNKDTVAKSKADENEAKMGQVKASVRERNEVKANGGEGVRENGDETVTKSDEGQVERWEDGEDKELAQEELRAGASRGKQLEAPSPGRHPEQPDK